MKPQISILFGHYSEDKERDEIALRCLRQAAKYRSPNVELIVVCNGRYADPELKSLADVYLERDVGIVPGRTVNEGVKFAQGDIFFIMSNDILLHTGALEQSCEIVRIHKKLLATPIYPKNLLWHNCPPVGGYNVNLRLGSNCLCMRRDQFFDIGWMDEVLINFDMINYINRWIRKGYAVGMTKTCLADDLGIGIHSYPKLQAKHQFKPWRSRKAIYDPETLERIRSGELSL